MPRRASMLCWLSALALGFAACDCGGGGAPDAGRGPSAACLVPTSSATWQLVNGGVAGPATDPGSCQRPVVVSALPAAQVQALGVHTVGSTVQFTVPEGTGGLSIVSQAAGGVVDTVTLSPGGAVPNNAVPTLVRGPGGQLLYDDSATPPIDATGALVWYQTDSPGTGAFTLPNTARGLALAAGGLPAGTWSARVNDWALECVSTAGCSGGSSAGRYDVTVVTRPLPYDTGTVDLSFYLVTPALTAAQALTDVHVRRFLSTLGRLYAQAGLCLGTITFYDVPAWARNRYATGVQADRTGPCDPMKQLFTLGKPTNGLHFFLVDAIVQSAGGLDAGVVVGVDGTIPGPSSFGGTVQSGAVVNFSDYAAGDHCTGAPNYAGQADGGDACGADVTAYIAAHEGGHFLGLYHTTEAFGLNDPLTDTPACTCSTACGVPPSALGCCVDLDAGTFAGSCPARLPTLLFPANCSRNAVTCGGASSLMFWQLDERSTGTLSDQQARVMRANPAVY